MNPSQLDMHKLDDKTIRQEIDRDDGAYGIRQSTLFSCTNTRIWNESIIMLFPTRIDKTTGKKIRDGYEKDKMQKFVKELEQKYQLKQEVPAELMNLKFTVSSKNLKQNLESLFGQLSTGWSLSPPKKCMIRR